MSKQPTLTLIESLFEQTKEYVDNRIELFKLKMVDKTANVASYSYFWCSVIYGVLYFFYNFKYWYCFTYRRLNR